MHILFSCLQHVDEAQLLYTFCRPGGEAVKCSFQEGEMLLLSVEGGRPVSFVT